MKKTSVETKKILVVRTDRFGEFLLIIPALRALKETFPGCSITALTSPVVAEIAACVPFIDKVMVKPAGKWSWLRACLFAFKLRGMRFDIGIIFNPSKELNIVIFLAGIPLRLGYHRKWGFLLTHQIEDRSHPTQEHEIDHNLHLVGYLGASTKNRELSLSVDGSIINAGLMTRILATRRPLVAIHPFTSDSVKQWPVDNFRSVAQRLRQELNARVIFVGQDNTRDIAYYDSFDIYEHTLVSLINKTTLPELAALLKRCDVLVSCDSGPVHLASCMGTPSIALFRSGMPGKTPQRWGSLTQGSIVIQRPELSEITVEEVVTWVKEIVKERGRP